MAGTSKAENWLVEGGRSSAEDVRSDCLWVQRAVWLVFLASRSNTPDPPNQLISADRTHAERQLVDRIRVKNPQVVADCTLGDTQRNGDLPSADASSNDRKDRLSAIIILEGVPVCPKIGNSGRDGGHR
jgi:hypothetical protein